MISWIASKSKVEVVGLVGCGRMGRCMLESVLNAGYRTMLFLLPPLLQVRWERRSTRLLPRS